MKKILLALLALTSISAFGAAGDVIFKQINPAGTAITDRVLANPSAIRMYGLNSNAGTWQPTQFALGTGLSIAGAFGSQTLNVNVPTPDVDYITFNFPMSPAWQEGLVFYDSGEHTLAYYNDESTVTHNIGQESWVRVRNTTGSTILNGQVVYINGAVGTRPTVALADADNDVAASTIGMATHDIPNNSDGYITAFGVVHDLNTSSFSNGDRLWLSSTAGALVNAPPADPAYVVFVGVVTRDHVSQGSIFIRPDAVIPKSSESVRGSIEIATQAETNTGTDDIRAITPLKFQTRLAAYAQPLEPSLTALATGSDFVVFTGPATSNKTFTLPNASSSIYTTASSSAYTALPFTLASGTLLGRTTALPGTVEEITIGTGVATALGVNTGSAGAFVVNGGALGTPSSGTVTNLTGTASININGTVGATTPSTVAATTISGTGNMWLGAAGGVLRVVNLDINAVGTNDGVSFGLRKKGTGVSTIRMSTVGDATGWDMNYNFPGTDELSFFNIGNGATKVVFTSTGINSTAIGATTPSTGSFTLLGVTSTPPASAGAAGVAGTITWDASYIYVAVGTNTWKRAALSTW